MIYAAALLVSVLAFCAARAIHRLQDRTRKQCDALASLSRLTSALTVLATQQEARIVALQRCCEAQGATLRQLAGCGTRMRGPHG